MQKFNRNVKEISNKTVTTTTETKQNKIKIQHQISIEFLQRCINYRAQIKYLYAQSNAITFLKISIP